LPREGKVILFHVRINMLPQLSDVSFRDFFPVSRLIGGIMWDNVFQFLSKVKIAVLDEIKILEIAEKYPFHFQKQEKEKWS